MLESGDILLVVHRRLFEYDHSRFFVGRVEKYEDGIVRLCGYTFARDSVDGNFCRKAERHTKLYAIGSGTLITYIVPTNVDLENIKMVTLGAGLTLTDGGSFAMNISEWVHQH